MTFPNDIDELDQQISKLSKAEISAFHDFEQVYYVQHPKPKEEYRNLGFEFWTTILTTFAAIVLAAFRTGQAFYLAAVAKGNPLLSSLEALAAVFAVEGSVVLFALQRAREAHKTDVRSSTWGLVVAFTVSVLAGLFQSINIIVLSSAEEWIGTLLSWCLIIAMGLGATVIAWLGGDILGVHLTRLEVIREEAKEQFARTTHSYRANLLKEWRNSYEQIAVSEQKGTRYGVGQGSRTRSQLVHDDDEPRPPIAVSEMYEIFDLVLASSGKIAGVGETARELMTRRNKDKSDEGWENLKSRVSGIRKKWMEERNLKPEEGE